MFIGRYPNVEFSGALSWERSVNPNNPNNFHCVNPSGNPNNNWNASNLLAVAPDFSSISRLLKTQ